MTPLPIINLIALFVVVTGICTAIYFIFRENYVPAPPVKKLPKEKKILKRLYEVQADTVLGAHCGSSEAEHVKKRCDCDELLGILNYIETGNKEATDVNTKD